MVNIKGLLEEANKYIKDPDAIVDTYDMTFVWVSERVKKMQGNMAGNQIAKQTEDPTGISDFKSADLNAMTIDYKVKKKNIVIITKDNKKKKATIKFIVIEYDNQPYLISKFTKIY
jgi:hypothetical protein